MSANDIVKTGVQLPRLESVRPISWKRRLIAVKWATGPRAGRVESVDLSPLIDTLRFYAPLRENQKLFASIHLINRGSAVAWGDEEVDMSSGSIQRLAEESMTADEFRAFLTRNNMTQEACAARLGRSKRMLAYYLEKGMVPRLVTLACFALEFRDKTEHDWSNAQNVSFSMSGQYPEAWRATPPVLAAIADKKQKATT